MTDAMLRQAAAKSNTEYVSYLEQGFAPENQHIFPSSFEKKMQKVKRKADHPTFYQVRRLAASFLLILLLGGGVWLAADVEARAAVWGWVRGIYETYFVFSYEEGPSATEGPAVYRPTWIPEGYTEFLVDDTGLNVLVAYSNENGDILTLDYIIDPPPDTNWFINISQSKLQKGKVNGLPADILISTNPDIASGIAWDNGHTAFNINGFVSEADLITMAESIQKIEK